MSSNVAATSLDPQLRAALVTEYRQGLAEALSKATFRAFTAILLFILVVLIAIDAQRTVVSVLTAVGLFLDVFVFKFWMACGLQLCIVLAYAIFYVKRIFGTFSRAHGV